MGVLLETKTLVFSIFQVKSYVTRVFPRVTLATCFPAFISLYLFTMADVSDADLISFCEEKRNENSGNKTAYHLVIFREYLE